MSIDYKDKANPNLITTYLGKSKPPVPKKRSSSVLNQSESVHQNKKANTGDYNMEGGEEGTTSSNSNTDISSHNLKSLLIPLMEKVDKLREAVDTKYEKLENTINMQKKRGL